MSAQVQPQQHYYSEEDYLDLKEAAEYKSEYHDGEIFIMAAIDVQKIHLHLKGKRQGLELKSFPFQISLSDIYDQVDFEKSNNDKNGL
ncbi:MAG: hypothetical protein VSS75_000785 [Candidatus Parabeggiatoa sp.]|nr:hypothetical protein [Candidatus Parabeggiatoa sp.]